MYLLRRLALVGLAALTVCAATASPASALEWYNQSTGVNLAVGSSVSGTAGTTTISGTFFGSSVSISCTSATIVHTVDNNSGGVVSGRVTSATWSGCSSPFKNPCNLFAVGLPWDHVDQGGVQAGSTTALLLGFGTGGAVDISDCMPFGLTCTITGATAAAGTTPLADATIFSWSNTATNQMSVSGLGKIRAKDCTVANLAWTAGYAMLQIGSKIGIR